MVHAIRFRKEFIEKWVDVIVNEIKEIQKEKYHMFFPQMHKLKH